MSNGEGDMKDPRLVEEVRKMTVHDGGDVHNGTFPKSDSQTHSPTPEPRRKFKSRSTSQSPVKKESGANTPVSLDIPEATIGGEVTLRMEPGKLPKLSRTSSQKVMMRPPPLFTDEPDMHDKATRLFQVITNCEYANKSLGLTEDEGLDEVQCECDDEWDPITRTNKACGEDSDCINRATKIECIGDCKCGPECQNKRFQHKQYAEVTVFQTEKKGFGLRADTDLRANDFVFEYIGEVIGENAFNRRMHQYDEEGIKHFYFMSLNKGEFIDATRKGNLGRFCNHSCNPNCYVDKWVVGDKLRMGIFAERSIKAGEELTFNYNVDRYGADPQPCYCGEPNCTGFIGGRTQTERATKLSHATIEALGIEDGDDWDLAVAKKARRQRKTGEADEEYVNNVQPKALEEDAVNKVMAQLMQKKEKWIVVKLLERIQTSRDEKVFTRVAKMHGYRILKSVLSTFMEDANVCLQVLDVLFKFPRLTRNKIQDSKIEEVVEKLKTHDNDRVVAQANEILDIWSKLELGYRIPKRNPNDMNSANQTPREDWRDRDRKRARTKSRSPSPPQGPAAPSGPRSNIPQRNTNFYRPRPAFPPRPPQRAQLPAGWHESRDERGKSYYYNARGQVQWELPTVAVAEPPPPPKPLTDQENLQRIIDECTKERTPQAKPSPITTPQPRAETSGSTEKSREWELWPEAKRQKAYDVNAIRPLVKYVEDKYKGKMKEEYIKSMGREIRQQIVKTHFKKRLVKDPTRELTGSLKNKVREQIKEFFSKAHKKYVKHKAETDAKRKPKGMPSGAHTPPGEPPTPADDVDKADEEPHFSDDEASPTISSGQAQLATPLQDHEADEQGIPMAPPPPPPPPPHSAHSSPYDGEHMETEQGATFATPPPPPPPPPRETEEASETLVKPEDEDESMEDVKSHSVDAMGTNVKRKREQRDEDVVMDEIFTESMAKKVKGAESELSPKINGIHKSEDIKTADTTGMGMNGIMAKPAF